MGQTPLAALQLDLSVDHRRRPGLAERLDQPGDPGMPPAVTMFSRRSVRRSGTESSQTLCWRKPDSNHQSRVTRARFQTATVVFVGSHERDLTQHRPELDRVVHHVHHHGVAANPEETLRGGLAVSDILLSRAADLAADMIVSGGYHHSPLREALLGGVSRELFQHMTVPALMSH
jgi:hypothetical protein